MRQFNKVRNTHQRFILPYDDEMQIESAKLRMVANKIHAVSPVFKFEVFSIFWFSCFSIGKEAVNATTAIKIAAALIITSFSSTDVFGILCLMI